MFFDTSLNPRQTVLANMYTAFTETAAKMWAYARCVAAAGKRPGRGVVVGMCSPVQSMFTKRKKKKNIKANLLFYFLDTIKTLVDVAFVLLTSKARRERFPGYECCVCKAEVAW